MKIYGAALAREPRKPSPFCDCLNKAKIPFQSTDGTRRILCALPLVPAGMRDTKRPEKRKGMRFSGKSFPMHRTHSAKPDGRKQGLPEIAGKPILPPSVEKGRKGGKAELHGGIPPRVEDINRRLPVTGQGKMEFLLRICLCYVPGVTWVRRLV